MNAVNGYACAYDDCRVNGMGYAWVYEDEANLDVHDISPVT